MIYVRAFPPSHSPLHCPPPANVGHCQGGSIFCPLRGTGQKISTLILDSLPLQPVTLARRRTSPHPGGRPSPSHCTGWTHLQGWAVGHGGPSAGGPPLPPLPTAAAPLHPPACPLDLPFGASPVLALRSSRGPGGRAVRPPGCIWFALYLVWVAAVGVVGWGHRQGGPAGGSGLSV